MLAFYGARHYAAGNRALAEGDAETAIREFNAAAERVPHASEIQNHLGLAYWQAGDVGRADLAFERAIELDCDNEAALLNRDRLHREGSGHPIGAGLERQPRVSEETVSDDRASRAEELLETD